MRTSNPALKPGVFQTASVGYQGRIDRSVMTVDGAVQKTGILTALLIFSAAWVWSTVAGSSSPYDGMVAVNTGASPASLMPWMIGGAIAGLIFALVTSFKPQWAMYTAPGYALCEGLFIGGISAIMELRYPGIVMQSAMLTMGTLVTLLLAYKAGYIRATEKFKSGVIMATGAIFLVYFVSMILGFFGVHLSYIHGSGPIGIAVSLVVVAVAALNLILDFDLIEQGARSSAPKYMEWYAGFALLVTLVWLYVEFLRLLGKLNDRK